MWIGGCCWLACLGLGAAAVSAAVVASFCFPFGGEISLSVLLCLHVLSVIVLAVMQEYSWVCYCFDDYIVVVMFGLLFSFIPQHHVILSLAGLLFCLDFLAAFSLGCWKVCLLLSGDPLYTAPYLYFALLTLSAIVFCVLPFRETEIATIFFFCLQYNNFI